MTQIVSVQILRAVAALAIVVLHALHDAQTITGESFTIAIVSKWPLSAGVDLFFVISGFVMVVASRNMFQKPGAASLFLRKRISRIVPIYWLVTSVFILIAWLRPAFLNSAFPTLTEIAKSYFFIPYLKVADGLVQPIYKLGWTLNYEMMFYCAFALVIMMPMRRALLVLSAAFLMIVAFGLIVAPPPGMLSFWSSTLILEFVAGMWIGYALLKNIRISASLGIVLIVAGMALLISFDLLAMNQDKMRVLGFGLPAALIAVGAALGFSQLDASNLPIRLMAALGNASYALYLCHPFAVRFFRLVWEKTGALTIFGPWIYVATATIAAAVAALLIYRFVEKPMTAWTQKQLGATGNLPRK
jgi:exopolysaccharide production protein ExoZ